MYIEWQIGYDVVVDDNKKLQLSSLRNNTFIGANGKEKALYELSEYLYYFFDMGIITNNELNKLIEEINNFNDNEIIENNIDLPVQRANLVKYELCGINFQKSIVKYLLLFYKLSQFDILTEIVIKEKQRAIGLQPMLFITFPIYKLYSNNDLIGRCAEKNETAFFILDKNYKEFILQTFKIFALLSKSHQKYILNIINTVLNN